MAAPDIPRPRAGGEAPEQPRPEQQRRAGSDAGSVLDAFAAEGAEARASALTAAVEAAEQSSAAARLALADNSDALSDAQFSEAPSTGSEVAPAHGLTPAQLAARREAKVAVAQRSARNLMKFEALKQERNALRAQVRGWGAKRGVGGQERGRRSLGQ